MRTNELGPQERMVSVRLAASSCLEKQPVGGAYGGLLDS